MDLGLSGKRAIVTGGTRGIGRAIVEVLAAEGASVCFCARTAEQVSSANEELEAANLPATGTAVDVTDNGALQNWVSASADAMGGIDIVVPNVSALAASGADEAWQASFDVDIMGTVHTVDAALSHLEKSETPAIVIISSVSGVETFGGVRAYNPAKAALIAYASTLSTAYAGKGIRANTVSPGTIYFEDGVWGTRKREQPELYNMALKRNPFGRMGTPEEVANAVAFLASPCASFISGTNMIVDGAFTQRIQF